MSKNSERRFGQWRFRRLAFSAACAGFAGAAFAGFARGATTWTNSTADGLWKTSGNWDTNSAPDNSTAVVFPAPGPGDGHTVTLPSSPTAQAGGITFNDDYTLTAGRLAVFGDINVATAKTATIASSV